MPQSLSIRTRFLLIVLLGAILPLAIVGAWLASSAVDTAETHVRERLTAALDQSAEDIVRRWQYRQADLLLLAENHEVVEGLNNRISDEQVEAYLQELHTQVGSAIPSLIYRDRSGRVRWQLAADPNSAGAAYRSGRIELTLPIRDATGAALGELQALLNAASLLPDTEGPQSTDAHLAIVHRPSSRVLALPPVLAEVPPTDRLVVRGEEWLALHRSLDQPEFDLTMAGPLAPHVAPYRRAARVGGIALLMVALTVTLLTFFLTARLTRGLERLARATQSVAAGDLDATLPPAGRDEVGRTTEAFNTMTHSLRRSLSELSQQRALVAMGEFAAGLSHEVRNALTSIRVDLERAERKIPDESTRKLVTRAMKHVQRIEGTVTGSLRVARTGQARREPMDVMDPLAAAIESASAREAAGPIRLNNGKAPVALRGDATALEQMFLNLLLNAVEAAPGRPVDVSVETAEEIVVSIADQGPGIAPEDADRVWQSFYTKKVGGTGLGLTIARSIAQAHGGDIALDRAPSGGTLALVRLPGPQLA